VRIAQVAPALPEGVSPTTQGNLWIMSQNKSPDRLARHPGQQGARSPAGNQAGFEKLATGIRIIEKIDTKTDDTEWIKHVVVHGKDEKFSQLSPIKVCLFFEKLIGKVENTTPLRSGSLVIHTSNDKQTKTLLELKSILDAPVEVTPHRTLNTCRGTVVSNISHRCSDDDLDFWFERQNIIAYKKIALRKRPLELFILTFKGKKHPNWISVAYENREVRDYIPNPLRCFNCQQYGHPSDKCRRQGQCANCGSIDHSHNKSDPCKQPAHCVNCKQDHPAYDKNCPIWIKEKQVQKVKVDKDISFPKARRYVEEANGNPVTYAAVASFSGKRPRSPRSSPRSTPRQRIHLSPGVKYNKNMANNSDPHPPDLFSNFYKYAGMNEHLENHQKMLEEAKNRKISEIHDSSFVTVNSDSDSSSMDQQLDTSNNEVRVEVPNSLTPTGSSNSQPVKGAAGGSNSEGKSGKTPLKTLSSKSNIPRRSLRKAFFSQQSAGTQDQKGTLSVAKTNFKSKIK
jgi:hypothetical protein